MIVKMKKKKNATNEKMEVKNVKSKNVRKFKNSKM